VIAVLAGVAGRPVCSAGGAEAPTPEEIDRAASRAVPQARRFLKSHIGQDGRCDDEYPPDNPRFGGRTALIAYALLASGVEPTDNDLRRALQWVSAAELKGTYAVSLRACALAELGDRRAMDLLARDAKWLIEASDDGAYTYTSAGGKPLETYDNSNSQMAVLGVQAAASRGVEVPLEYWRRVERHWLSRQQADGGWGYRVPPKAHRTKTYGSMTAAGVATLHACFENLRREDFIRCAAPSRQEPLERGLAWLDENFSPRENPHKGVEWQYYWLYCVSRVGVATGRRYMGGHDWYVEGASELLRRQDDDGGWGYGARVSKTSFALLFLARGAAPVVLSKLRYAGRWNARPHDAAGMAEWLSHTFERPLNWQVIDVDSPVEQMSDAPILYLSGAGAFEPTDEQVARLRTFALRGGLIVSEAACNSGAFTRDVQKLCRRMFPQFPFRRLADDHALYSAYYSPKGVAGLFGVDNGVRLLAVHSPRELSLAFQLRASRTKRETYDLLTNVYVLATDLGKLLPRSARSRPVADFGAQGPASTFRVARIGYDGNCDPEPLAWRRLANMLAARHRIRLEVTGPIDPAELNARTHPAAAITGTAGFTLTERQSDALRKYITDGGTLIADAAGSSGDFAASVEQHIFPLIGDAKPVPIPFAHRLYADGPERIETVAYRRATASRMGGEAKKRPRLIGLPYGGQYAVIFSRDDLTAGLCGYEYLGLRGYRPESAVRLMTNILWYASAPPAPTSASAPTSSESP